MANHRRSYHQYAQPLGDTAARKTHPTEREGPPLALAVSGCQRPSFPLRQTGSTGRSAGSLGAVRRPSHRHRGSSLYPARTLLTQLRAGPANHVPGAVEDVIPNLPAPRRRMCFDARLVLYFSRHLHERRSGPMSARKISTYLVQDGEICIRNIDNRSVAAD